MELNTKWVPINWPCGPLEIALLNRFNAGDDESRRTADAWTHPSMLRLLKGTPVNCLVVDWAFGVPEDLAHQRVLKPLIDAGRDMGMSFVGRVAAKENLTAVVEAARLAGIKAVLMEGPWNRELALPIILQASSNNIEWDHTTSVFVGTDNRWPGASLKTMDENMDGDTAVAGPTGSPWTDSNAWLALLSQEMAPEKALWLAIDPPESRGLIPAEEYCRTVADAQVCGGRWMISLDRALRAALLKEEQRATDVWDRIHGMLAFFEEHAEWGKYQPMGTLAVVSDFRGKYAFTSAEVLSLLNRRQIQFVVMDRKRPLSFGGEWLKGILWLDDEMPARDEYEELLRFVEKGGLVISSKYWGPQGNKPYTENWLLGYSIYQISGGKIVVADGGLPDPFQIARDAHLLVSRKNDFVRLYNAGSTKYYSCMAADRKSQVVQVLNYSTQRASYITLWLNTKVRSARLWRAEPAHSSSLVRGAANEGTNLDLPEFSVMCAVEAVREI